MATIFPYEVEVKIIDRVTGQARLLTRTEYAYSVVDACHQTIYTIARDCRPSEECAGIVHVGPPAEAVAIAAVEMRRSVEDAMARIILRAAATDD